MDLFWIFLSKSYIIQEKINSFEYWVFLQNFQKNELLSIQK